MYIGLTVIWAVLNTFALEVIALIDIVSIWWQVLLLRPCIHFKSCIRWPKLAYSVIKITAENRGVKLVKIPQQAESIKLVFFSLFVQVKNLM